MHLDPRKSLHLVFCPIRAPRAMVPGPCQIWSIFDQFPCVTAPRGNSLSRGGSDRPPLLSWLPSLHVTTFAVGMYGSSLIALTGALWAIYGHLSLSGGSIRSSPLNLTPTGLPGACLRPSRAAPEPACHGTAAGVSQRPWSSPSGATAPVCRSASPSIHASGRRLSGEGSGALSFRSSPP